MRTSTSVEWLGGDLAWLVDLFDRREPQSAFLRVFSQFLMDRARAGLFWINAQMYANLAKKILKFLGDK